MIPVAFAVATQFPVPKWCYTSKGSIYGMQRHPRARYPITVRVRCGGCARVLSEFYGDDQRRWITEARTAAVAPTTADALLYGGSHVYRCRCGMEHRATDARLRASFAGVASAPAKRDRVIELPLTGPRG